MKYEKLGFPTCTLAYSDMLSVEQDASVTRANSMPALRMVTDERSESAVDQAPATMAAIVKAWTDPLTEDEAYSGPYSFAPEPPYIYEGYDYEEAMLVMEGDLNRCVYALSPAEYTDGSPVQLPIESLVNKMLAATSQSPDKVVGPLGPNMTEATVRSVAVNGVMAGCKPETMPLLLALTEAMSNTDIAEALMGAQGWFSFGAIVNGPYAADIRMNTGGPNLSGPAPLTPGVPANTSVGRFMRLMMINIGGIEPGIFEAKGIGNPHKSSIVMAEASDESPWPQYSADLSKNATWPSTEATFSDGENTVTFFVFFGDMLNGFRARYTGPTGDSPDSAVAERILGPIAEAAKFLSRSQQGLCVFISPAQAEQLADAGYTRQKAQQWISDHCVDVYDKASAMGLGSGVVGTVFSIQGVPLNPSGQWPAEWRTPGFNEVVKYYPNPDGIQILVGIGSYGGLIMNGTPRWTVAIDKWK
ncbi:MAG: hypothetical protein FWH28_05485 [Clostridiales bacterium]|nr:hypothetical protein [Clostridiales bacterium]